MEHHHHHSGNGLTRRGALRSVVTGLAAATAVATISATSTAGEGEEQKSIVDDPKIDLVTGHVQRTSGTLDKNGTLVSEAQRSIPIQGKSQVLVCGGGPAGIAAALAAARAGASVRLIELAGCLGGVWTAGLLTKILDGENKTGIMKELLTAFSQRGSDTAKKSGGSVYDPEIAKAVLEELLTEAKVSILYHTRVVGVITAGRRIAAVLTESKSGRQGWTADTYVDCTGDGDLAAQAGCRFDLGRDADCACQPMSLMALLTGIDFETAVQFKDRNKLFKLMQSVGIKPSYRAPTLRHLHSGIYSLMANHEYGVSAFDADAITQATIRSRREINDIVNGLRKAGSAWSNVALVATAEQIGIREGRRILGRYHISQKDVMAGLRHQEAICRSSFPIDIHGLSAADPAFAHAVEGQSAKPFDIPYPALVAADVDGLLMAGRCISGDFIAHASYRVTGNSVAMGEAAGLAAATSVKLGKAPHELSWASIRSERGAQKDTGDR